MPLHSDESFLSRGTASEESQVIVSVLHYVPDIDECSQPEPVCSEEHQECINNKGSYVCICSKGYEEEDGKCVETPQSGEDEDLIHMCSTHSIFENT